MNTKTLCRHYDALTPWERLPLIMSASARGDNVERERLVQAAPKNSYQLPDYWGLGHGLADLAKVYLMDQLDKAALYWQISALVAEESRSRRKARTEPGVEDFRDAIRVLAHRCVVQADAWESLGAELHFDPDRLTRHLPGYQTVCWMVETARRVAFTREQASAYLGQAKRLLGQGDSRIETVEEVVQSMREILRERLAAWR
jgi:hypothetical protein